MKRNLIPFIVGLLMAAVPVFGQTPPGTPELPRSPAEPLPPSQPGNIPGPGPAATPGARAGAPAPKPNTPPAVQDEPDPATESEFLTMIGQSNRNQLKLAQLAAKRAQNPAVKTFAQSMVQDATTAGKTLTRLNKTLGFKATAANDVVADASYKRISALNGAAFDTAFLQEVQRMQASDILRFDAAGRFAGTKALKSYLNTTLPALKFSAERVDRLSVSTGGTAASPPEGPTASGAVPGTTPAPIPSPVVPGTTPGNNPRPGTQAGAIPGQVPNNTNPGTKSEHEPGRQ
ncbi:MAG TPA: DUF4142 domain-containing protein [Verrucomicrobiales bacterium]|nr:DUF4142 domain-containing protein [Verrucomicrobiales bacterium]